MLKIINKKYVKKFLLAIIMLQMLIILVLVYLLRVDHLVKREENDSEEHDKINQETEEEISENIDKVSYYNEYTVKDGDTLVMIADKYSISASCIVSANNLHEDNVLKVGQKLYIPVTDEDIKIFDGSELVYDNCVLNLTPDTRENERIDAKDIKPFLQLPFDDKNGSTYQCWKRYHSGIDFLIPDRRVLASAEGKVVYAGYSEMYRNFGKIVIIEHSNQMYTGYLNLGKLYVIETEQVAQGELIGEIDDSTKANLHFMLSAQDSLINSVNPSFFFVDGINDDCYSESGITYEDYLDKYIYY